MWLGYPLFYSFIGSISSIFCALILTQYKSLLSTYTILFIKFIILTFPSLFLSLKNSISKLLIRGVLCPILIWWLLLFLIPPIRFVASERRAYIIAVILLLGEIMPSYSCYKEKKLVYIVITAPFSRQPFSYIKCTKSNMWLSCNIKSVSNIKCL